MYFFLRTSPSLVDLCYSSVITPKALANLLSSSKVITFEGCVTQFFFFALLGTTEAFLLAVMAYDRSSGHLQPLHYPITMCPLVCARLVLSLLLRGCLSSILPRPASHSASHSAAPTMSTTSSVMCRLCSKLACADTAINELVIFGLCGFFIVRLHPCGPHHLL